jgi:hypothetical protein
MLQVPVFTLAHWASRREGPAYLRIGRHVRYTATDVEDWLSHRRVGAARQSRAARESER